MTEPTHSPEAMKAARELHSLLMRSRLIDSLQEIVLVLDRFRAAGVEATYKHCLQLADDMTSQRALIRTLMPLAGVEKFKRTTKCLVCMKNLRAEDGGMLCQSCRGKVDAGDYS